jgi:hypothetical protein
MQSVITQCAVAYIPRSATPFTSCYLFEIFCQIFISLPLSSFIDPHCLYRGKKKSPHIDYLCLSHSNILPYHDKWVPVTTAWHRDKWVPVTTACHRDKWVPVTTAWHRDKWVPVTTAWRVLKLRMKDRPTDMEGSCA